MAAPSLAMAVSGLALKPSTTGPVSPPSYVVLEPVTSSSSSSSQFLSNCSSSVSSPPLSASTAGALVVVQQVTGSVSGSPSSSSATTSTAGGVAIVPSGKDSGWLTLEVCREHIRQRCTRSESDCRFAHPPPHVDIQNGRVVCCFDSIKGRCQRNEPPCKYLHPPQHLKEQLLQNGRNNLIMKNLQQIQRIHQNSAASVVPSPTAFYPMVNPYVVVNPSSWYPSYYNNSSMQAAGIVPPPTTAAHNGCVSMTTPAVTTPTATVAPAVEHAAQELEQCADVTNVSQAGTQYWTLSPSTAGLYGANQLTSPYYSPCSTVYYQNGNYSIPPNTNATMAMLVPKRSSSSGGVVHGSSKTGYSPAPAAATTVYPCGSAAYQQMALSSCPVDMPSCYAMAITVPPPVNGFYGY